MCQTIDQFRAVEDLILEGDIILQPFLEILQYSKIEYACYFHAARELFSGDGRK